MLRSDLPKLAYTIPESEFTPGRIVLLVDGKAEASTHAATSATIDGDELVVRFKLGIPKYSITEVPWATIRKIYEQEQLEESATQAAMAAEPQTGEEPMTTTIKINVNGNYIAKGTLTVTPSNGDPAQVQTVEAGPGNDGPDEKSFYVAHGSEATLELVEKHADEWAAEAVEGSEPDEGDVG